jgi:branched-chain amino acid transport system permease protein
MAAAVGIIFVVVVVGGLGSLAGAFITSLLIGMMQTFAVALDVSLASLGLQVPSGSALALARLTLAQVAPVLPYLLLVVMLVVRPGRASWAGGRG